MPSDCTKGRRHRTSASSRFIDALLLKYRLKEPPPADAYLRLCGPFRPEKIKAYTSGASPSRKSITRPSGA